MNTVWIPVRRNWRVYVKFVGTLPFPIIDCIIIILSFTMTVGILMLHCGQGIRNTDTFYTFRCPQSLEMIRLYLCKQCKLERDMTLCGDNWLYKEASLKKSGSSLLNSARKQWCQCLRNIKIKLKCEKKDISVQQICFKFSWRIKVLHQWVSVIFCLH
jgi:hypothetical protein